MLNASMPSDGYKVSQWTGSLFQTMVFRLFGANFSDQCNWTIENNICNWTLNQFSYKKFNLKITSAKWQPFPVGLNVMRWNFRADFRFTPSQWETSLQSNAVSHWLGASLKSALNFGPSITNQGSSYTLYISATRDERCRGGRRQEGLSAQTIPGAKRRITDRFCHHIPTLLFRRVHKLWIIVVHSVSSSLWGDLAKSPMREIDV